ncbi:MAG: TonB-dependent receptor plug domain-containing protein [Leptospirales bacterium]|nr:TonB-dependent receptor plug domain-containing protein [Leptospirales bacterium]
MLRQVRPRCFCLRALPGNLATSLIVAVLLWAPVHPLRHLSAQPGAALRAPVRVLQAPSRTPLADSRVIILELGETFYADEQGRLFVELPRPGLYTLRVVAGEQVQQFRRQLEDNQAVELLLAPPEGAGAGPSQTAGDDAAVTIVGLRDRTRLSRYRLTQEEIRRLPGAYGDALRAVETLPGVAAAPPVGALPTTNILTNNFLQGFGIGPPYRNSTSGFLTLRGAGPRASRFYLDGFKIQYPFHLGDQSSVVNNQYLRVLDVFTGTYPARFGDSTGGIIWLEGPTSSERPLTNLNIALFKSDVYHERPLFGGISFFGTAKQSYPNYVLLRTYPDGVPANAKYANYQDGQFKIGGKLNASHEVYLVYFGSRDILDYAKSTAEISNSDSGGLIPGLDGLNSAGGAAGGNFDSNTDSRPPVGLDRGFHTQGLSYAYQYGGWLRSTVRLQTSRFREDYELDFRSPFTGETIFGFEVLDARREFYALSETEMELISDLLSLRVGAEHNDVRWELSLRNFSPQSAINPNTPSFVDVINDLVESNRSFRALYDGDRTRYHLDSAYFDAEVQFWRIRLTPGLRNEYYSLSHSRGLGPRLGFEFAIDEIGAALLLGAGRHFNVPPGLNTVSEEAGNPWLRMEEADRLAGGIEQKFGSRITLKLEAFRNAFRNLVVEDAWLTVPFSPRTNRRELASKPLDIAATPYENRALNFSNDGTGFSEGGEIFLRLAPSSSGRGLSGWLSYTNSITKRNNHQPRLTQDQRDQIQAANVSRKAAAYIEQGPLTALYYDSGETLILYDNDRDELFDLDHRHQASMVVSYKFNAEWQLGVRWRYNDNTPYTPITSADSTANLPIIGRPTFIPKYSDRYNSARLLPIHQLDIRLDRFLNYEWGFLNYYVELINVYGRRNPETENFDFLNPYVRGVNPAVSYESTYISTPIGRGRNLLLPLINLGVEARF